MEKTKEDLSKILSIFHKNQNKHYYVIGNHCLTVPRNYLLQKLNIESKNNLETIYYDFVIQNFRFIILDGTDISLYGWENTSGKKKII